MTVDDLPDPLPEGLAVLDVREPVEWAHGHIEGAVHIPLMELPQRLDEVPAARSWWSARSAAARAGRRLPRRSRATTPSTSTAG